MCVEDLCRHAHTQAVLACYRVWLVVLPLFDILCNFRSHLPSAAAVLFTACWQSNCCNCHLVDQAYALMHKCIQTSSGRAALCTEQLSRSSRHGIVHSPVCDTAAVTGLQAAELQRRLEAELPRQQLDLRHRLDKYGQRYGKVIDWK